jgi:hypothetical protein
VTIRDVDAHTGCESAFGNVVTPKWVAKAVKFSNSERSETPIVRQLPIAPATIVECPGLGVPTIAAPQNLSLEPRRVRGCRTSWRGAAGKGSGKLDYFETGNCPR